MGLSTQLGGETAAADAAAPPGGVQGNLPNATVAPAAPAVFRKPRRFIDLGGIAGLLERRARRASAGRPFALLIGGLLQPRILMARLHGCVRMLLLSRHSLAREAFSTIMLPVRKQLLVLGALFLFAAGSAAGADFSAGAAKRRITPELKPGASVWMAGFANGRAATGVHDDLWTRCLAMSAGGRPLAICGVDAIGLFFEDVQKIRDGARAELKRDIDVIVVSTHVHEGPDTMGLWGPQMGVSGIDEAFNQLVVERTVEAVEEAVSGMRPATVRAAGVKPADVGRFFDDDRPPNLNDPDILVLGLHRRHLHLRPAGGPRGHAAGACAVEHRLSRGAGRRGDQPAGRHARQGSEEQDAERAARLVAVTGGVR
jgi:hypothetical protein